MDWKSKLTKIMGVTEDMFPAYGYLQSPGYDEDEWWTYAFFYEMNNDVTKQKLLKIVADKDICDNCNREWLRSELVSHKMFGEYMKICAQYMDVDESPTGEGWTFEDMDKLINDLCRTYVKDIKKKNAEIANIRKAKMC